MFRSYRSTPLILAALLIAAAASSVNAQVYDLAADWSEVNNPNGTWAYGSLSSSSFSPFTQHFANWRFGDFTNTQPYWGINAPFGLMQSQGGSINDFPAGRVGGHTAPTLAVQWTAPTAGTADITGGVWMFREIGRANQVSLFLNGTALFDNVLIPQRSTGINSGNTFTLSNADVVDGGSASDLLGISVNPGDKLVLALQNTGTGDYSGVDFNIRLIPGSSSVPEPGVVALLVGMIPGAMLLRRRRK